MAAAEHRHRPWRLFIGRSPHSDLVLSDRTVSRVHAAVCREEDRWTITDLDSANGVLVNGARVESAVLEPGDVIHLGRVRLFFWPGSRRLTRRDPAITLTQT